VTLKRDPDDELNHIIDDKERGLKDTIRVNPNEIVEIAVRFTTYAGRYMYHCHILEHEDRDMMRPFVTMTTDLMPFMSYAATGHAAVSQGAGVAKVRRGTPPARSPYRTSANAGLAPAVATHLLVARRGSARCYARSLLPSTGAGSSTVLSAPVVGSRFIDGRFD